VGSPKLGRFRAPKNKKFRWSGIERCPHCGGKAGAVSDGPFSLIVVCDECGCRTWGSRMEGERLQEKTWADMWWKLRNEAVEQWNKRVVSKDGAKEQL